MHLHSLARAFASRIHKVCKKRKAQTKNLDLQTRKIAMFACLWSDLMAGIFFRNFGKGPYTQSIRTVHAISANSIRNQFEQYSDANSANSTRNQCKQYAQSVQTVQAISANSTRNQCKNYTQSVRTEHTISANSTRNQCKQYTQSVRKVHAISAKSTRNQCANSSVSH